MTDKPTRSELEYSLQWCRSKIEEQKAEIAKRKEKAQYLANHKDEYGHLPSLGELMNFVKEVAE